MNSDKELCRNISHKLNNKSAIDSHKDIEFMFHVAKISLHQSDFLPRRESKFFFPIQIIASPFTKTLRWVSSAYRVDGIYIKQHLLKERSGKDVQVRKDKHVIFKTQM